VLDAPVNLVYVADLTRTSDWSDFYKQIFPYTDTAFIAENVYLYCASAGLETVIRAWSTGTRWQECSSSVRGRS